ncbi:hypothetical protein [Roseibium suaedae]|uniref:Uncharacterized protein n=1 Tax=Roseibium suaedae TaxID=735517 RepID=A0A1M7P723_9HYPH|nr:hypothetical protein [Roseibium suaedae]SHN12457.1 hypothetical protein SAMN05444272_4161 [Roseibium suaedae]
MTLPKIINCSGFAQTGCTAQVDVLRQYHSIAGFVEPYNEFGILKNPYSFGGVLISLIHKHKLASKEEMRLYLMGDDALNVKEDFSLGLYLKVMRNLKTQVGEHYVDISDKALAMLPDNYQELEFNDLFDVLKASFIYWIDGLREALLPAHWPDAPQDGIERILGLKNDPTGAMPALTGFYPEGSISSAIIRDPRDTNMDFNRHYGLGHSIETVNRQCAIYKSQLQSCMYHVKNFRDRFEGRYFIIQFERLVQEEDYREAYVQKMIGNRPKVRNVFDAEKSAKNVGLYKDYDPVLVEIAKTTCMDLYEDFLRFAETEGLLFKGAQS